MELSKSVDGISLTVRLAETDLQFASNSIFSTLDFPQRRQRARILVVRGVFSVVSLT